jgi:hypothetical protein
VARQSWGRGGTHDARSEHFAQIVGWASEARYDLRQLPIRWLAPGPVGFRSIRLTFDLDTETSAEQI